MTDMDDALAAIWARSRPKLQARLVIIRAGLAGGDRQAAEAEAHKLAGLLGTFGLPEGTRVAREIEQGLQRGETENLAGLIDELEAVIDAA